MASPPGEVARSSKSDFSYFIDAQICEASADQGTRAKSGITREVPTSDEPTLPLMADFTSGPNTPIAKGFLMAQWRTIPDDRLFGEHHDLSNIKTQMELHKLLPKVDSVWAALDCSTKTNCTNNAAKNNYSCEFAENNAAAAFILAELKVHHGRGGGSSRENPVDSWHWNTPTEMDKFAEGVWDD